jgi:hypothetical protein
MEHKAYDTLSGRGQDKLCQQYQLHAPPPGLCHDPEAPLNAFIKYVEDTSLPDTWADPDKCAAVLFDVVLGQKDRPLPMGLVRTFLESFFCHPGPFAIHRAE